MSAACTWGLRGAFFRRVFCDLPPFRFIFRGSFTTRYSQVRVPTLILRVFLELPLARVYLYSPIRVRTLILRVLFSFSWNFRLCVRTCCHIIATSPQTICHHHRRIPLPFNHHHQPPYMTSYLRSIAPQTSIATIEFICPSWLKRHPPLSLCLRHSLL